MSRSPIPPGSDPFLASPTTPGSLGYQDGADPHAPDGFMGGGPNSVGILDHGDPDYARKHTWANRGTLYAWRMPLMVPGAVVADVEAAMPATVSGPSIITTHPAAPDFYRTFPEEPLKGGGQFKVTGTVNVMGNSTFDAVLNAILKAKSKDIMIVSHGHGGGLSLPLIPNSEDGLGIKAMDVFAGKGPDSDLDLPADALAAMKRKVAQVKALNLRTVVLRACIVGQFPDVMEKLKEFFNCQVVDAPKALDGYGKIDCGTPTRNPDVWEKWLDDNKGATVEFAEPNRFAWLGGFPDLMRAALADSDTAIKNWLKAHLPVTSRTVGRRFPYHALDAGTRTIFPADADYRNYLSQSS